MAGAGGRGGAHHPVEFPGRDADAQGGGGDGGGLHRGGASLWRDALFRAGLAELAERAGIPAGVFNVVTGRRNRGGALDRGHRVRALSFTGSTNIGQLLYRQCAGTVKKLVMELGGHAPVIVFKNADLETAIEESVKAKFATSGQDCLGANRIYVERAIYDEFCRRFTEATQKLTLGRGMDDPDIGPLMNEGAVRKAGRARGRCA